MPTTAGGLPYPSYLSPADAPDAIMDLAVAVEAALNGKSASGHVHTIATLPTGTSASQVALGNHTHSTLPATKPKFGMHATSTSAAGEATLSHGAGFTPSAGVTSIAIGEAGTDAIAVNPILNSFTATTFRVRAYWARTGLPVAGSCTIYWVVWA